MHPEVHVSREDLVQMEGTITEVHAGGNFEVTTDTRHETLARFSGRIRRHHIRVVLGDRVTVAVSPYDPTHGLVVYRAR